MNKYTNGCRISWALTACLAAVSVSHPSVAEKKPNVIYLLADQWRASATGYAGDPNVKTPHLDALAAEGINFANAVSVSPVCTPHRAALMTGRYPTSTGMFMNDLYLPDDEVCMAEIFRDEGYATGYIGKWHLDGHGRSTYIPVKRRQGFDFWRAAECDHNYPKSHYYAGTSDEKLEWEGYDAFAQTDEAERFIRDRGQADAPFLLMVSYGTPHFPHGTAPKEYQALYSTDTIKLAPNVPDHLAKKSREELVGYYGHCTALDECVGRLIKTLEETGLADNTILVFTSDHGEMMGAQGIRPNQKQRPWDESIRVPFLLRYPEKYGRTGRVIKTPINTPDILPTLLSMSGAAVPDSVEGKSMEAHISGTNLDMDRAALVMSVSPFAGGVKAKEFRGIRTSRYSYIKDLSGPWLLYDNEADPFQMENLIDRPAHAALQKSLEEKLQEKLREIGDEFRPRADYLAIWNYHVNDRGTIPYTGEFTVQTPAR
jgi:arylsulfatase A-like enzyme